MDNMDKMRIKELKINEQKGKVVESCVYMGVVDLQCFDVSV